VWLNLIIATSSFLWVCKIVRFIARMREPKAAAVSL
jgi:hypothetical protein